MRVWIVQRTRISDDGNDVEVFSCKRKALDYVTRDSYEESRKGVSGRLLNEFLESDRLSACIVVTHPDDRETYSYSIWATTLDEMA